MPTADTSSARALRRSSLCGNPSRVAGVRRVRLKTVIMQKKMTTQKKAGIALGSIIVLWYAFVLLLPWICHGELAFPAVVRSMMKHWASSGESYEVVKTEIVHFHWSHGKVSYASSLSSEGKGKWVLIARPSQREVYDRSLLVRIIWLDCSTHRLATYRIRPGDTHAAMLDGNEAT